MKKYAMWTVTISGPGSTLHNVGHRIEKLLADEGAIVEVVNEHPAHSDIQLTSLKDDIIKVEYHHKPWGG